MKVVVKHTNPLVRSGISQIQRELAALKTDSVKPDERSMADLILFGKYFAQHLSYYNQNNTISGTWLNLMSSDISVILAEISKLDAAAYREFYNDVANAAEETDNLNPLKKQLAKVFDLLFTLTVTIDQFYKNLPESATFKKTLGTLIQSALAEYYQRLKKYYDKAVTDSLLSPASITDYTGTNIPVTPVASLDLTALSSYWTSTAISFTPNYYGSTKKEQIKHTFTNNLFTSIVDAYLKGVVKIAVQAEVSLQESLTNHDAHTPHYALYLTFLKLFVYAQDGLNTFTERHLDFYYKEFLQITEKEAEADEVFLIFELAKTVNEYLVSKGTAFKGGKDADGLERYYTLVNDLVVNKAEVKSIAALYTDTYNKGDHTFQNLYALPVANSDDGEGAKLTSIDDSWPAFGNSDTAPLADIGFAITSHHLYLAEGDRIITFTFEVNEDLSTLSRSDLTNRIEIYLTGKKGWYQPTLEAFTDHDDATVGAFEIDSANKKITVRVHLDGGSDAIIAYDTKTHGGNYDTTLPIARFMLTNEATKGNAIRLLQDLTIKSVGITTSVTGMKSLSIQSDQGPLDPSKSFFPFGSQPHQGSYFVFGSKEIFQKNDTGDVNITLNLTWDNYLDAKSNEYLKKLFDKKNGALQYLRNGRWRPDVVEDIAIFYKTDDALSKTSVISLTVPSFETDIDPGDNIPYAGNLSSGFGKIMLSGPDADFGVRSYPVDLATAAIEKASYTVTTKLRDDGSIKSIEQSPDVNNTEIPAPPYIPSVKEFTVNYTASTTLTFSETKEADFDKRAAKYFHVHPFGYTEVHPYLNTEAEASYQETLRTGSGSTLGLNFSLTPKYANEGELLLGIDKIESGQTLSILFEVVEGSSDPLTETTITWYYLAENNTWFPFDELDIEDGTNNLIASGIIKFSINSKAAYSHTLFSEGYLWLRGVAAENTNAVCRIIGIHPQAGKASLSDYAATGNYFKTNIEASSISKPVVPDASVKKITQPYRSAGGRIAETGDAYYTRVSERLRHKNRAATIWDYEHLVLESFPQIYRVKCLNHTRVRENTETESVTINSLAPGHVTLLVLPDLTKINNPDIFEPYTSTANLEAIETYLADYISPFVTCRVLNPFTERIKLDFKVQFSSDDGAYYHDQLIEHLNQFLCPWAYDDATEIELGGKIRKSSFIDFIEGLSYVDYVTCFKMYHYKSEEEAPVETEEAEAYTPLSVFVPFFNSNGESHSIEYESVDCNC